MKIGVKIHPDNTSYAKKIEKFVDFYEVVIMEGKKYDFLKKLKHPFFFHSDDFKYQTNLANPDNNDASERYLKFAFDLMKQYKALGLVVNPGTRFNNRCSADNVIGWFKKFGPKKIILENQPPLKNRTYPFFARSYDEVHLIMKRSGVSCCIDFDHAYASAFFYEKDPVRFVQDLLDLKPKNIHISNGRIESYIDSHLHFLEGDFNMMKMKSLIPPDVMVTVDTANDFEIQLDEIKFLRS